MLLEFKARNYKSFKEDLIFSLMPAPKQKGLDYSILKSRVGKKVHKGLCASVIYGPNASGKTNIIGAMDAFKMIVLRGNLHNDDDKSYPNPAASSLELIPNCSDSAPSPVAFTIKFIEQGLLVEYGFSADLGRFLSSEHPRKILTEVLRINEEIIFSREASLEFGSFSLIRSYLSNAVEQNAEGAMILAKGNLIEDELFLMNGFRTIFSAKLVSLITEWLEHKFMVIYRADSMNLIRKFSDPKKKSIYIEKTTNEAAHQFGITSNALVY